MSQIRSRLLSQAVAAALTVAGATAGAGTLLVVSAAPAFAVCKYGGPNCVNPRPNFDYQHVEPPTLEGTIDDWINQDCEYYNNCGAPPQDDDDDEEEGDADARGASDGPRAMVVQRNALRTVPERR